jgi:2-iminobutanoate/2-iminopropanoate deaminase
MMSRTNYFSLLIPTNRQETKSMKKRSRRTALSVCLAGLVALPLSCSCFAQHRAIGFQQGMPFSDGYLTGNTLYVAGQQGPDAHGKVTGTDITFQTKNAIAAVEKVVKEAGFQMTDIVSVTVYVTDLNDVEKMNEVYKRLMPDPKPARATVQVAGLIGGAKIEISAIAVKH